jgi:hypothetical protein
MESKVWLTSLALVSLVVCVPQMLPRGVLAEEIQ